jgi:hypothetical protein
MPSTINTISSDKLARLIGTPHCPALIDVCKLPAFEERETIAATQKRGENVP